MARLWVGNCDNEYMVSRVDQLSAEFRAASPAIAARLIWLLRDDDVLLLPQMLDTDFVNYAAALAGFDPDSVHVVSAGRDILTADALQEPGLLCRLRELVRPSWELRPYHFDRGIAALGRALRLPVDRTHPFHAQGGVELLNSKVTFRALAAGLGIPTPEGTACRTAGDLSRALARLMTEHAAVIVKRDRGCGGYGSTVVTTSRDLPVAGAESTICVAGPQDLESVATEAGLACFHAPEGEVVVEVYHPNCRSVFVEICCPKGGAQPYLMNSGELRMAADPPILAGLSMPLPTLPAAQRTEIEANALRLARAIQQLGYIGLVNIDAIVSSAGTILFNEINARVGGPTHLHRIASRLLGENWAKSHVLLSRGRVCAPPLRELLILLTDHGLHWDPTIRQGVVVAVDDTPRNGTIEYVVVAPDRGTGHLIEQRLHRALGEGIAAQSQESRPW